MMQVRRGPERGHFNHGWLDTYHTFSFADYHDPRHHNFRALRVMNEDVVAPGGGFDFHPHRDMEIVTYVLDGAIEHRDSLGNRGVIRAGELQQMTAGTGILHSEANPSATEPVHLYQIWLFPEKKGLTPRYDQKPALPTAAADGFQAVVTSDGRDGTLRIHQDAAILLARLTAGARAHYNVAPGRHAWVQILRGAAEVNGEALRAGDGAALSEVASVAVTAGESAEIMLFDLA